MKIGAALADIGIKGVTPQQYPSEFHVDGFLLLDLLGADQPMEQCRDPGGK